MYRSSTGQTGTDAYAYELAAIKNARRDLDERMARLVKVITEELPADASYRMSIATDKFPDAYLTADADAMRKQLAMCEHADEFGFETVEAMLKTWGQS